MSKFSILFALLVIVPRPLFADGDPATDDVAGLFAYSGVVEKDGVGISGDLTMSFKVFDGLHAVNDTPTWMETQFVSVHGGRFSVLLGECDGLNASTARCPNGDGDTNVGIVQIVQNADDLYLAVVVDDGRGAPVALQNLKRFVPVPYAHLSAKAANLNVANDLNVAHDLTVANDQAVSHNLAVSNDLAVSHNLAVSNDLTVASELHFGSGTAMKGLRYSDVFTATSTCPKTGSDSWGTVVHTTMTSTASSVCFLTQNYNNNYNITNDYDNVGNCEIFPSNGHWVLRAQTSEPWGTVYRKIVCSARCLEWSW